MSWYFYNLVIYLFFVFVEFMFFFFFVVRVDGDDVGGRVWCVCYYNYLFLFFV